MHGSTDSLDLTLPNVIPNGAYLTQSNMIRSEVKWPFGSHPSYTNNHTYSSLHILKLHVPTLVRFCQKLLPVIPQVACSYPTLLPDILHRPYYHTHYYGGMLEYSPQNTQCKIPLRNIPSIVLLLIFFRYFFLILILVSKSKFITVTK